MCGGKIDKLTQAIVALSNQMDQRFEIVDKKFDAMDQRFDVLEWSIRDTREDLNKKIDETNRRIDKGFGRIDDFVLHLERHDHEIAALSVAVDRLA
ncbi:MAG: hypothetical protein UY95_C0037G0005 [Parcubacteria group bacterium GW2011_GWA2_56_7]|nr:MAG: hypothetical protein UY95_C0037G0005 [Parcubacteria group bacterium GW2011_GWA2_56_7]